MRLITHLSALALLATLAAPACDGATFAEADPTTDPTTEAAPTERGLVAPRGPAALDAPTSRTSGAGAVGDVPEVPEVPPTTGDVCVDTATAAHVAIEAARVDAAGCQRDAHCVVADASVACVGQGDRVAVSFAGRADFEAARDAVEDTMCNESASECPIYIVDYFTPVRSICVDAVCELAMNDAVCEEPELPAGAGFAESSFTAEGCLDCDLAASKARAELAVAVDEAAACEVDADCVHVSDFTGCDAGCGVAVNASAAAGWSALLDGIASDWCAGDCPVAMPGCLPMDAVCDAGRCAMVMVDPPVTWE